MLKCLPLLCQDSNLVELWEVYWSNDALDACCNRFFKYAGNCNRRQLSEKKFFSTADRCKKKSLSQFRAMEERFESEYDCCREKFPQNLSNCCKIGDGCDNSINLMYIPVRKLCL